MARGGRRAGTPGRDYANRSDLRVPAQAPTGLPYGEHQALINDQRAIPLRSPGSPSPAPTSPGVAAPGAGTPPAGPQPGSLPWMHPTARPNEPVQHGLASGPGGGPEVLPNFAQGAPNTAQGLLSSLANQPGATDAVKQLASYVQSGKS